MNFRKVTVEVKSMTAKVKPIPCNLINHRRHVCLKHTSDKAIN